MNSAAINLEAQRIADYAAGWNDAASGRASQSQSIGYALGYLDASR